MPDNYEDTLIRPGVKSEVAVPKMWAILFLNDDFTPMDFVIYVLLKILKLETEEATRLTLTIHKEGKGMAGRFTRDVAETKAMEINGYARANEYPLMVTAVQID